MSDEKKVTRFRSKLPKPTEVPEVPNGDGIDPILFQSGYEHGLVSNVLRDFRKSFRFGFRKAKLEQQEQAAKANKNVVQLGTPYKGKNK